MNSDNPNAKTPKGLEYTAQKIEFQNRLVNIGVWQSCVNCDSWLNGNNTHSDAPQGWVGCSIHKAMPPPHIIVSGCKDHVDQIPF